MARFFLRINYIISKFNSQYYGIYPSIYATTIVCMCTTYRERAIRNGHVPNFYSTFRIKTNVLKIVLKVPILLYVYDMYKMYEAYK